MTLKLVNMYDTHEHIYRICRVVGVKGNIGDGQGYSWKLSFSVKKQWPFLCIKLHKSYGGIYV